MLWGPGEDWTDPGGGAALREDGGQLEGFPLPVSSAVLRSAGLPLPKPQEDAVLEVTTLGMGTQETHGGSGSEGTASPFVPVCPHCR